MALSIAAQESARRFTMPDDKEQRDAERVWWPDAPAVETADMGARHGFTREQYDQLDLDLRVWAAWVKNGRKPLDAWASGATAIARFDPKVIHGPPPGGYGPGRSADPDEEEHRAEVIDRAIARLAPAWRRLLDRRYIRGWTNVRMCEVFVTSERTLRNKWRWLYRELYIRLYSDPAYEATRQARARGRERGS